MKIFKAWVRPTLATFVPCGLGCFAQAAELVIGQVAPLSGVLASTGHQIVVGGKIYFDFVNSQRG